MSPRHHRSASRSQRVVACALVTVIGVGLTVAAEAAPSRVAEAEAGLARATAVRIEAEDRLASLEAEQRALEASIASLSGDSATIADALAEARALARIRAVEAYTNSGSEDQLSSMLHSSAPTDASVRTVILTAGAHQASDAAARYETLKQENDPELVALGEKIDAVQREIDSAWSDVAQASALESDAERELADARRARDLEDAAARATTTTVRAPRPTAPPVRTVAAAPVAVAAQEADDEDQWARLRECESGGNYQAVSASGRYRGAYQFDRATWESVGGTGDPAAAPAVEQDLRAQALFEARGSRAWPHCGRHLR